MSSNKTVFLYAISAISVLMLASVYPGLAKWLVGILILGVLLRNADVFAGLLKAAQGRK